MSLTPRQQKFADEYIISGNAYQSAIKAGYKEAYAKNAYEKMVEKGGKVAEYINSRMNKLSERNIMTQEQVLEELTKIALRQGSKGYSKTIHTKNGEVELEEEKEYEHTPTIEEQTRALELLGKRYALFTEKKDVELRSADINIVIGEPDGD